MAKILILNGSPHLKGNTSAMVDSFLAGAKKAQNEVVVYNVAFMNIHDSIGFQDELIHDDMNQIEKSLLSSDYVVLASPLYFFSFSGYLKNVIDRFASFKNIENKKLLLFVSMASDNPESLRPIQEQTRLIADHLKWSFEGFSFLPSCKKEDDYTTHFGELEQPFQMGLSIH